MTKKEIIQKLDDLQESIYETRGKMFIEEKIYSPRYVEGFNYRSRHLQDVVSELQCQMNAVFEYLGVKFVGQEVKTIEPRLIKKGKQKHA